MSTASELDRVLAHAEATEVAEGVFVVSARGPIDGGAAGELRDLLVPIAAADGATVVLDLVDADYVDEETVSLTSVAAHLALGRGSRLRVATGRGAILALLHERGVHELVTVDATVHQALARD